MNCTFRNNLLLFISSNLFHKKVLLQSLTILSTFLVLSEWCVSQSPHLTHAPTHWVFHGVVKSEATAKEFIGKPR